MDSERQPPSGAAPSGAAAPAPPSGGAAGEAAWWLRVDDPKGACVADRRLERRRYVLGRGLHCDLRLPARDVSREHAALECDDEGRWWLVDLGSTSGTFLNGKRFEGRRPLSTFDVAYLGEYRLQVRCDEPSARPSLVLPADGEREAPARLRVYEGPLAGRDLRLDRGRVVFGEGPDATLRLEGEGYAGVRVVVTPLREGAYEVVDESARPSLTVDGRPAASHRLAGGDALLAFGAVERQRASALDAFSVRYLPTERAWNDETPPPGGPAGEGDGGRAGGELETAPWLDRGASAGGPGRHEAAPPGGASVPSGPSSGRVGRPAAVHGDAARVLLAPWPDVEFGTPANPPGVAQTVELRRPGGAGGADAAAPLGPASDPRLPASRPGPITEPRLPASSSGPATEPRVAVSPRPASAPPPSARLEPPTDPPPAHRPSATGLEPPRPKPPAAAGHLGQTVVSSNRAEAKEGAADEPGPISLSRFLRPLGQALSSRDPAETQDEDAGFDPTFSGLESKRVGRTLRLSERNWPPQREALRARAEAGGRRWLWPGGVLALAACAIVLFLATSWRRAPARPVADGVASAVPGPFVAPGPSPSAVATNGPAPVASDVPPAPASPPPHAPTASPEHHLRAAPPHVDASAEAAPRPDAPVDLLADRDEPAPAPGSAAAPSARPGKPARGADGVDAERRRRLQELCKQRGDCSP